MLIENQLDRLRAGVNEWNEWRRNNPDIAIDLSGASLSRANLSRANLSGVTFCMAVIDGATVTDIGGPGHILCALTDDEWEIVKQGREAV